VRETGKQWREARLDVKLNQFHSGKKSLENLTELGTRMGNLSDMKRKTHTLSHRTLRSYYTGCH